MGGYLGELWLDWQKTILRHIPQIIQALIILAITLHVNRRLQGAVERTVGQGRGRRELARLLGRLVRIGVLVGGVVIVLGIFDQTEVLASFIASLGIFGLLIAFALQDITKNFAAGVLLLIQRPFGLDDRIRVGAHEGTVTDVSLRATVLRTIDGHEVLIPNADVYSGTIVNLTRYPLRRHAVPVTLPATVDPASAQSALLETLRQAPRLELEPPPQVVATTVAKDDLQFEARFWLQSAAPDTPAIISAVTLALQQQAQALREQPVD
ncbi:MAG TPA: mechanosensitive ion channel family protein, partial [Herpetosiphonaceae bacterium]|nr:mechanosensitive ion channel family protein [Herpetosiphonaceae bacterium]